MKLEVGDTIKCRNKKDLVESSMTLQRAGIETDFLFKKNGEKGYWLMITKISKNNLAFAMSHDEMETWPEEE